MDAVSSDNPLTNVARLSRCIKAVSVAKDNTRILQIVYYQTGIGRGTSIVSRGIDGATGRGTVLPCRSVTPITSPVRLMATLRRYIHQH
jgi:Uncharacterized alpha/beta hydrolase domain (DUF2235)